MKLADISDHSRAAFYLSLRRASRRLRAVDAWHMAGVRETSHWKNKEAYSRASESLSEYWQALECQEPKRYSEQGERLQELRTASQRACTLASQTRATAPANIRTPSWQNAAENLRYVGRVVPESRRYWQDSRGDCGWLTDPYGETLKDGSGLCFGVVYQLTGKDGTARYVAGYEFGGVDGGPTLDFSEIYTCSDETDPDSGAYYSGAVAAADSLAQNVAEKEKEYQTAWRAGSDYATAQEEVDAARQEALKILAERRAAGAQSNSTLFPHLCTAIRAQVSALRSDIEEARDTMRARLEGRDNSRDCLWWDSNDDTLRAAFCDGAGLAGFPD